MFSSVALLAIALVPLVLSAALTVAPVPWVPPVACPAYSADPMVPSVVVAIAPVPSAPPFALVAVAPVPSLLVAAGWSPEEFVRGSTTAPSSTTLSLSLVLLLVRHIDLYNRPLRTFFVGHVGNK